MNVNSESIPRQRSLQSGVIAVVFLTLLAGCGSESPNPPAAKAPQNAAPAAATRPADSIEIATIGRIDSVLAGNRGRWVLLNVWATWCRPCVAETPELVALSDTLRDAAFTLLGVSTDLMTVPTEQAALTKVSEFRSRLRVNYPLFIYSGSLDDLVKRFSLTGAIPATILYDPQGVEKERWVGRLTGDDFKRISALVG